MLTGRRGYTDERATSDDYKTAVFQDLARGPAAESSRTNA
jgi:hypothetical protein